VIDRPAILLLRDPDVQVSSAWQSLPCRDNNPTRVDCLLIEYDRNLIAHCLCDLDWA
jgi:hypothetical protein